MSSDWDDETSSGWDDETSSGWDDAKQDKITASERQMPKKKLRNIMYQTGTA